MKFGFGSEREEIEVDEDLPNFFEAMKLEFSDELVMEA
jgi:hypothetical protein